MTERGATMLYMYVCVHTGFYTCTCTCTCMYLQNFLFGFIRDLVSPNLINIWVSMQVSIHVYVYNYVLFRGEVYRRPKTGQNLSLKNCWKAALLFLMSEIVLFPCWLLVVYLLFPCCLLLFTYQVVQ